jgi:general L-amino acid transport system permease protein
MTAAPPPTDHHASVPPWRDVRVLGVAAQVAVVLAVGLLIAFLFNNLTGTMAQRGLSFDFDFLDRRAGFEIGESPVPYDSNDTYGQAFMVGLLNTLFVSVVGIVLATVLGLLVGVARLSSNWLVSRVAAGYVELMRNTPLLVQLFFIYFAILLQLPPVADTITLPGSIFLNQRGLFVPSPLRSPTFTTWLVIVGIALLLAIGLRMVRRRLARDGRSRLPLGRIGLLAFFGIAVVGWFAVGEAPIQLDVPERGRFNFSGGMALSTSFTAILVGLVIYTAAFIAEVVRGGIQAVRRGQLEAARALGLSEGQTLRLVVFPQALRIIVPPLTSQYLNLAKNSSLAIAVGYPDLFKVGTTMTNQTGQPVPVIVLVMGTYLAMSLVTSLFMNLYNRRIQVLER